MNEVPMGYACPKTVKGNYFLKTNQKTPFGKRHGNTKGDPENQKSTTPKSEDGTEKGQNNQNSTTETQSLEQDFNSTQSNVEEENTTQAQGVMEENKNKGFKPISSAASKLKGLFS